MGRKPNYERNYKTIKQEKAERVKWNNFIMQYEIFELNRERLRKGIKPYWL